MKKTALSSLFLSAVTLSAIPAAQADTHSLSLGYAQSRVEHFKDIRGVNLKYRYETKNPVGMMASFSWQGGDYEESGSFPGGVSWKNDVKAKYWSLLAGPALRVNQYASVYALAGIGNGKVDVKGHVDTPVYRETFSGSESRTGFAWGLGVQFNPTDNVVLDVGYEGSKIDAMKVNGFNLGVGYRF